ncbi:hypothetical protein [Janthinobacterium sp. SUN033]|uniref:hypothetical protein n=1 Tax=Janthinobacterium sp. SUN033 TaxID=3002439 RepID=UPI0025AEE244|nr:hypothetical protein [Janthinobacterium sp. SUN033]MDN2676349.1 hypothetical protein [Janthinobacterium sp. SUN033]
MTNPPDALHDTPGQPALQHASPAKTLRDSRPCARLEQDLSKIVIVQKTAPGKAARGRPTGS